MTPVAGMSDMELAVAIQDLIDVSMSEPQLRASMQQSTTDTSNSRSTDSQRNSQRDSGTTVPGQAAGATTTNTNDRDSGSRHPGPHTRSSMRRDDMVRSLARNARSARRALERDLGQTVTMERVEPFVQLTRLALARIVRRAAQSLREQVVSRMEEVANVLDDGGESVQRVRPDVPIVV